jgi:hypothetical protein
VQVLDLAHRQLGVPGTRHAEMGGHAAAEPAFLDFGPDRIDDARDLAAGNRRQLGQRVGPHPHAGPDRRVDQVHAGGGDRDPDLPRARLGVRDLLVAQVPGRAEGVQPDGAHQPASSRCESPNSCQR